MAVSLTEYQDRRIIQRYVNTENRAITIAGTCSTSITSIEARIVQDGTSTEVVTWTVIDAAPSGGLFSGTLVTPQGGWYNIQVRDTNNTSDTYDSTIKIGVGIIFWMTGQSNGSNFNVQSNIANPIASTSDLSVSWWFNMYQASLTPSDPNYWADDLPALTFHSPAPVDMAGVPTLANILTEQYGIPVGVVNGARGGSPSSTWDNQTDTNVIRANAALASTVDNECEYILFNQGEQDANSNPTVATYLTALGNVIPNLRSGKTNFTPQAEIPFLVNQLSAYIITGQDPGYNNVREAQRQTEANYDSTYLCATLPDSGLRNNTPYIHYNWEGNILYAERIAQTVKYILGSETYYRGPVIDSVTPYTQSRLLVNIAHSGGDDITPISGIVGFKVFNGATEIFPVSVMRIDKATVAIDLPSNYTSTLTVHYLYGSVIGFVPVSPPEPVGGRYTSYRNDFCILDNSSAGLPLEPKLNVSVDMSSVPTSKATKKMFPEHNIGVSLVSGTVIN